MKANYYDPMFYVCSEEMPFTIRIEVTLKEKIDKDILTDAVNTAMKRYPYFRMRLENDGKEISAVPNNLPLVIYNEKDARPLGGPEVNYHVIAFGYYDNVINFYASHVITDGASFMPLIKSVLYYYISSSHKAELDHTGINLADEPFFPDELGNPYPEEKMKNADPMFVPRKYDCFKFTDGPYVTDNTRTIYRLRLNEGEILHFSRDNDASPCALISSFMVKAIRDVHPETKKDIVSAISFNMRPALGNRASNKMVCSYLPLNYPYSLKDATVKKLCTCSRGMITIQSQSENVLYAAQKRRELVEKLADFDTVEEKQKYLSAIALADATNNTFSVSYVGQLGLGETEPHVRSIYNATDGSTYNTIFIEICAANGWFNIAFLQGFSSDVYYRAFLKQLDGYVITYLEDGVVPLNTPKMMLP